MFVIAAAVLLHGLAADDVADRMATLNMHYTRLELAVVPPQLQGERDRRLRELRERLDAGAKNGDEVNALYREMDLVRNWLWDNAAERPGLPPGDFIADDAGWTVRTPDLTLQLAAKDLAMSVSTGGYKWHMSPSDAADVAYGGKAFALSSAGQQEAAAFDTGYGRGMALRLADFPEAPGLTLHLTALVVGREVIFDLAAEDGPEILEAIHWPKAVELRNEPDTVSVLPMMQGSLVPGNWDGAFEWASLCDSRELYMPWWGHIQDAHGVQVIIETPFDGGAYCHHPAGGPTRILPRWFSSLGKLGYLRTVRYVFSDKPTYVTMAKRYRRHVREQGRFVSLAEKRLRNPNLDDVIGMPIIHIGALYHTVPEAQTYNHDNEEFNTSLRPFDTLAAGLRKMKEGGLDRAYVHLDGWGYLGYDNAHPDVQPPGFEQGGWDGLRRFADTCADIDYLFAVHDQYRDFYMSAASFDDRLTVHDMKGERFEVAYWCGGPQTVLSSRFASEYVRHNHDLFAEHGVRVRGAYLDVFSVLPMDESSQPAHPVSRRECAAYRRACFDLLRARGYVVSSEEPTDCFASTLDLVHHGPYYTEPNIGANGPARGIPVPLFNLVYHDALITPWDMGDAGGWGIPEGTAGRLHCLLNAGAPYAGMPYGDMGVKEKELVRVKEAAKLAGHCALLEMTNHEFLNDTRTRQRSTFSDGTRVTVDFADNTSTIEYAAAAAE